VRAKRVVKLLCAADHKSIQLQQNTQLAQDKFCPYPAFAHI
jgi:hypothetical protein